LIDDKNDKKWANKLSVKCGVEPRFLQLALEELKESCGADSTTSKEIVEELTTTCHFDKKELGEFIKEVSKNCPMDIKKLKKQVEDAHGDRDTVYNSIQNVSGTDLRSRQGTK
jgi:hypothetical protein